MRLVLPALLLAVALAGCRVEPRSSAPPQAPAASPAAEAPRPPAAPRPVSGDPADNPIVLYVTEWCPYCAQAREYMAAEGVPHTVVDIEKDPAGRERFLAINEAIGGQGGIPIVAVGPQTMQGWNAEAAREMLDSAGYP